MAEYSGMRWYNPKLKDFEWRELPSTDQEALAFVDGYPSCEEYAAVYKEWRKLGAGIMAALIRAGELAREKAEKGEQG
jgi:hypothetical protein